MLKALAGMNTNATFYSFTGCLITSYLLSFKYTPLEVTAIQDFWQSTSTVQYSLLGRTAASIRLNTTFRGLATSPSSGKTKILILKPQ
jgi:hypothetical protein